MKRAIAVIEKRLKLEHGAVSRYLGEATLISKAEFDPGSDEHHAHDLAMTHCEHHLTRIAVLREVLNELRGGKR